MRWRTTELLVVSLLAGVPSGAGQGTPSTPTASRLARPALAASPTPPSAGDPAAAPSAEREAPSLGERWLFNARERTQRGLGSLEESRIEEAASAFDAAARLRPGDPMTAFNAGTGRLAAGLPEAVSLLEKAARSAPVGLAPQAWYNLGAARLKAGDGAGAVEAYKEALRREPGFADAKHNLELALQQLEQQKKEQERAAEGKKEQQEKQDKNGDDRERSEQENSAPETSPEKDSGEPEGKTEDEAAGENPRPPEGGEEQQKQENSGESTGEPDPTAQASAPQSQNQTNPGQSQRALPRFRDLPDMSAEEAAAILAAVENLEREQRRAAALALAAERARVEKDW